MNGSYEKSDLVIRGRIIREAEMAEVRRVVGRYDRFSRARIAHELCKLWDWRQSNGKFKELACLAMLKELDRLDLIELPPSRKRSAKRAVSVRLDADGADPGACAVLKGEIREHLPLSVKVVESAGDSRLWRGLIDRYHYLGYRHLVGASIRHLVYDRHGDLLALLGWQSAVLHLACRDRVMGLDRNKSPEYLERVANNTRFLVLPWVRVPNAASAILSKSIRSVRKDWLERYGIGLWLLESFVDRKLFEGTCYRAANWIAVGTTKGYGKREGRFEYHGKPKEVYVYVLNSDLRREILNNPEERRLTREFLLSMALEVKQPKRRMRMKALNENWDPKPPPKFELNADDIANMANELGTFHSVFKDAFRRVEQIELSQQYLQGLMSRVPRKNVEAMALCLGGPRDVRGLQRFMTEYKWDEDVLRRKYWEECAGTLAASDGVLSVDASETEKKGRESVGVAPQYCGNKGKTANCQSGVYVCYATSKGYVLLNSRLYMPKKWFEDEYEERRGKCRVPEDLEFLTKPQIAGRLVHSVFDTGLFPCRWITADASFGNNGEFLGQLPSGLKYLADISCTRRIWIKTAARNTALEKNGCTVSDLLEQPGLLNWEHRKVAEGAKGPVVADFARIRVYVSADRNPEDERWLFLRNAKGGEIKYALSNAPEEEAFDEMVRVSQYRWPVERCFQEGKGELGMDHYEHRSWPAWHRHMIMVCLAQLFLLRMRLKFKKKSPALTLPQCCMLIQSVLPATILDREYAIEFIQYHQKRNYQAYLSHRKREIANLRKWRNLEMSL